MITGVVALTDVTLVLVSRDAMNSVVQQDHRLARQIGEAIELRRRSAREALSEAADRKSTRLNSSHIQKSRMPSSA